MTKVLGNSGFRASMTVLCKVQVHPRIILIIVKREIYNLGQNAEPLTDEHTASHY